eukprot:gnl/TRDRNA2_/TRDRNA2_174488_c0_seq2.p1 gnl/TRDRNA2_/TRDRNA2_174488_c0~~gnl/TRDRNA2_/TRDRNA2_174488_c0_seq2.p1  ORF type:complete len:117 (-),score=28.00 gnl/TRDRNA2_/TRDRNA2_174488_c0_seq2:213-563(-)
MRTMPRVTFVAALALCCLLGGAEAGTSASSLERAKEKFSEHEQALAELTKELAKIPDYQRKKEMIQDEEASEEEDYDSSKAPPTIVLMNKIEAESQNLEDARATLCQLDSEACLSE